MGPFRMLKKPASITTIGESDDTFKDTYFCHQKTAFLKDAIFEKGDLNI